MAIAKNLQNGENTKNTEHVDNASFFIRMFFVSPPAIKKPEEKREIKYEQI